MADIRGFGFLRHLRAETSSHMLFFRGAKLRREGRGLASLRCRSTIAR
jgi:hypothetical protein